MNNMILNQSLRENEVAILDFSNRQVDIIHIPNLSEVEDLEEVLIEMGYNPSEISYMS